jgi:hypothetical protein
MAQRVQVLLIDDIDGSEGAETVTFSLDGVSYEIDLSAKNAAKLRDAFAMWVGNARKVGRGSSSASAARGSRRASRSGNDTAAIRSWAKENGYEVSERGRISRQVMDAYAAR